MYTPQKQTEFLCNSYQGIATDIHLSKHRYSGRVSRTLGTSFNSISPRWVPAKNPVLPGKLPSYAELRKTSFLTHVEGRLFKEHNGAPQLVWHLSIVPTALNQIFKCHRSGEALWQSHTNTYQGAIQSVYSIHDLNEVKFGIKGIRLQSYQCLLPSATACFPWSLLDSS